MIPQSRAQKTLERVTSMSYDELCETLREKGVRGYANDTMKCPIATFIKLELPGVSVSVQHEHTMIITDEFLHADAETSAAMSEFMVAFDSGNLPEFDAEADR